MAIKTRLAEFVEALQIPWPEALPLVLPYLRPTPLGPHKLSPFDIVTGHTVHLTTASSDN